MNANRAFCAPMTRRNAAAKELLELRPPIVGCSQPSGGQSLFTITLRHEYEDKEGDLCRQTLSIYLNRTELADLVARLGLMLNAHQE